MIHPYRRISPAVFVLSASMTLATVLALPASAEVVNLKANLASTSEVPPTDSKGSGAVAATFDTTSKKLTWKGSYKDLTGPATAAHFHIGDVGKNGAVAIPISPNASPFEGSATLTDTQAADLLAGRMYVNVHTAANKAGEIRGQVTR
ncbi:MAG TPA: CHRD domain-containing protein [Xanthobacteraceae bacterium]|nr:CHRD domain-containing protein [Xanthobacteraceae bacterium]HWM82516.1 CHRD domain-containing protein [Pseudolabrys sp.]